MTTAAASAEVSSEGGVTRLRRWAVLFAVVVATAVGVAVGAGGATGQEAGGSEGEAVDDDLSLVRRGAELYEIGCSGCHGLDGGGLDAPDGNLRGPSVVDSGEASAYYYLTTGRMPLANAEEIPERKDPAYAPDEIAALVAYVGSLGDGPELPEVDVAAGDLQEGGALYRANCQACHSASAAGGALSYGRAAPTLHPASPEEIAAAVRAGPGQMPVFGPDALDDAQVDSVVAYVRYLRSPDDPGGLPIGRTGPVPEGFVAWVVGMGAMLALIAWIGTRSPVRRRTPS